MGGKHEGEPTDKPFKPSPRKPEDDDTHPGTGNSGDNEGGSGR
ncbi:hypothetical protein [Nonomuraea sp. NPDC002799]